MLGMILGAITVIAVILLFFWKFIFLRNPERNIPQGDSIVSPADGRVISIIDSEKIDKINIKKGRVGRIKLMLEDVAESCYVIVIMMNVLNVHYQRAPIAGTVSKIRYEKGNFFNVVSDAESLKSLENEKNEILIEGKIKAKVVQIAGLLARRIECFVEENKKILKGERIGLINLGSQVVLVLPKTVLIKVKIGEKVKAGSSVLAELK